MANLLLQRGANPNAKMSDEPAGWTVLHEAAKKGMVDIAELLLKKGANPNAKAPVPGEDGWTVLREAVKKGNIQMIQLLLSKGADPNLGAVNGWTPLHEAAYYSNRTVAELLLEKGANPNAKATVPGEDGWTVLQEAVKKGNIQIIQLLLDKGADLNLGAVNGLTPLHDETAFQPPKVAQSNEPPVLMAEDGANKAAKTQRDFCRDLAWDWLNKITGSWLHGHVSAKIENFKRPKIAIIDTGFDGEARMVDRKLQLRLNMIPPIGTNWKDYWQSETVPQDNDGHGTAMLSIIHRIAPFADICVARIAGNNENLKKDPIGTSKNLAKAILWAVEQDADIVSLSLGWEEEPSDDKNRAISNAISNALSRRNQNLLIFAAASNLGGSKHELFPANHQTVFSIRGTNAKGKHEEFNPSLPKRGGKVFGTLGLEVPASNRGTATPHCIYETGTSVATAVAAGIAAIVVGYINIHDKKGSWEKIRMFEGFQNLLYELSTEPDERKLFITLDNYSKETDQEDFNTALNRASNSKQ